MDVITLGSFDLPHLGHFKLLKKCREIAGHGKVIVGLNTDDFYSKYRGYKPVLSYKERMNTLQELPWVDLIVPNNQDDNSALDLINSVKANLIAIGSDWSPWSEKNKNYLKQLGITQDDLDRNNISLCFVPYTKEISSSKIKNTINSL